MHSRLFLIIASMLLLTSFNAAAHHAMEIHYLVADEAIIRKEGVIKNFSLLDPHSYLVVSVEEQGKMQDWVLEAQSKVMLTQSGWRFDLLKAGTPVRFLAYPARNGDNAGRILILEVEGTRYCSDRCDLLNLEMPEISGASGINSPDPIGVSAG